MIAVAPASLCWTHLEDHRSLLEQYLTRRCRDVHEVEDVVQESFLRAAACRERLRDGARIGGWLLRIAANVLADRARRDVRRRGLLEAAVLDGTSAERVDGPPEEALDESEWWIEGQPIPEGALYAAVASALGRLRDADRRILLDRYVRGLSCRRAAELEGIGAETLKVRLFRARQRLRLAVLDELAQPERRPEVLA